MKSLPAKSLKVHQLMPLFAPAQINGLFRKAILLEPTRWQKLLAVLSLPILLLLVAFGTSAAEGGSTIKLWHTFGPDSVEEKLLLQAIEGFERHEARRAALAAKHTANDAANDGPANEDASGPVTVEVTRIPYLQNMSQYINAAQAGEAPDILRLSDTEIGKVGHVSLNGQPILEDLRAHLTPVQMRQFTYQSLQAMRYQHRLLALPLSQGSISLLYNKRLFDEAGVPYPDTDWTTRDLLGAAKKISRGQVKGITLPLKWSYWLVPFLTGFGGGLFDDQGRPTFGSAGADRGLLWFLDLDRVEGVAAPTSSPEAMTTQFQRQRAAMVLDGPWNWRGYADAGIDLGQAVLPVVSETGQRMRPMASYFGWAVSKQSHHKEASARLALWLCSAAVQRDYALESMVLPTRRDLINDTSWLAGTGIAGFLAQIEHVETSPTTPTANMLYEQLDTALELVHTGQKTAEDALNLANEAFLRLEAQ